MWEQQEEGLQGGNINDGFPFTKQSPEQEKELRVYPGEKGKFQGEEGGQTIGGGGGH